MAGNEVANRNGKFMEPVSKWFGYGLFFGIALGLGCDRYKIIETKISRKKSESIEVYEPSRELNIESPKQVNASTITVSLKISISGFSNSNGSCRVAVYLDKAHFNDPEYAMAKESIHIVDSKAIWQVEVPIPVGTEQDGEAVSRLAVSAYHDENENSRLDKNSFGIPTERYGFSNNPKRGYGPPKFREVVMLLDSTEPLSNSKVSLDVPVLIK